MDLSMVEEGAVVGKKIQDLSENGELYCAMIDLGEKDPERPLDDNGVGPLIIITAARCSSV